MIKKVHIFAPLFTQDQNIFIEPYEASFARASVSVNIVTGTAITHQKKNSKKLLPLLLKSLTRKTAISQPLQNSRKQKPKQKTQKSTFLSFTNPKTQKNPTFFIYLNRQQQQHQHQMRQRKGKSLTLKKQNRGRGNRTFRSREHSRTPISFLLFIVLVLFFLFTS